MPRDLLADALEALTEGIAIYDAEGALVVRNTRYHEISEALGLEGPPDTAPGVPRSEVRRAGRRIYEIAIRPTANGGLVVTQDDVTQRREAERIAAERDTLLSTILDTNPAPVVMARLSDSRIIYRSPAAREIFGDAEYASDLYVDPAARDPYVEALRQFGRVEGVVVRGKRRCGGEITIAMSGALAKFNGETCAVTTITDLTERIEREAMLRQVVESCPAPVLMNRAETGEILYRSPELIALLGEGLDARDFYVDPSERAGFLAALREKGEVKEYRERLINAAGEPFWAAVSGRLIEKDGEEVLVTFTRDLTQQLAIEAELDRQRQQTFQNEKMSALGGLLAGVAHELNNPLSVVVGHAMMLQEEVQDPDVQRQTRKISEAAERCARIVRTFLAMARQEPTRMDPLDVNDLVRMAVDVARYGDSAHGTQVVTDLGPDLPAICGDADQLAQVIINLILNAEQAIDMAGKGDRILISTRQEANADEVLVTVDDNGPGIPAEMRGRVFEPFFTTKGVGKGTGIGLSLAHRIVSAHNGRICAEEAPAGGARFRIMLPQNLPAGQTVETLEVAEGEARACRVLVIDDEEDVADLNVEVLARSGYDAQVAYRAEDALRLLGSGRFDVVVSDLNMPGIDGRALFETIRRDHPALADSTGFVTGDTLGRSSQLFLKESRRPYLEKPVSPRELREFVARLSQRTPS